MDGTDIDREENELRAAELAQALAGADLPGRIAAIAARIPGRIVFTTSFGIEDQAITHAIVASGAPVAIVTLDTGRLFPETYEVWAETEALYARRIRAVYPAHDDLEALIIDQGINGFRMSPETRKACCEIRKVRPLKRALDGARGWVTGLRAGQSPGRAETPFVEVQDLAGRAGLKINPLADWSRARVETYIAEHGVPCNVLHDRGFPSIGCAPCTRAIRPGEDERAGRWWWEKDGRQECGLHVRAPARIGNKADHSAIGRAS